MRSKVRAYSHQGHGPRADQQAGYISATSDSTTSLANGSRSIHLGQQHALSRSRRDGSIAPSTVIIGSAIKPSGPQPDLEGAADTHTQLDQPPLPIWLQTAAEPKMLWRFRRALSYQPVIEGLASLAVSLEFPDKRYLAGILRVRIAPLSSGANRLAVHLLVDDVMDDVRSCFVRSTLNSIPGPKNCA